tara:strand:- start:260 stop:640 length:381 start_codon:yes stop_codon:yes gene_type:complete
MKIQITGLPCSGKTTTIKNFIKQNPHIKYIDIRDYKGKHRIKAYKRDIKKSRGNLIAESACGVHISGTEVVRLEVPDELVFQRAVVRDNKLDEDYMSLLKTEMIPAKYTVRSDKALVRLLDNIFNG